MKKLKGAVIGAGGIAKNAHALAYENVNTVPLGDVHFTVLFY